MARDVIPDYFPDKCVGCEVLGDAITLRDTAIENIGLNPRRKDINEAERLGNIARRMCQLATENCRGLAEGCYFEELEK